MVRAFGWNANPWSRIDERVIDRFGTAGAMLRVEEKRYLYWLMRDGYEGKGAVLDLGPLLGGSTLCLAAGGIDNERLPAPPTIEAYDLFSYDGTWGNLAHRGIKPGDTFLDLFIENTRGVRDHVRYVAGDILATASYGNPIEVLFVDLAKSERLLSHVMQVFYPKLLVGSGVVVHQDYKFVGMPYLKVFQEAFADCFELLPFPADVPTVAFRLARPLPQDFAARVEALEALAYGERRSLLQAARDRFAGTEWHIMNSSLVLYECSAGELGDAETSLLLRIGDGEINKTAASFYRKAIAQHPDPSVLNARLDASVEPAS